MKDFITKHKIGVILIIPGIIAGYLYWRYVGCSSGTCAIKSHWETMTLFGGLIGYLVGDTIDDIKLKRSKAKEEEISK